MALIYEKLKIYNNAVKTYKELFEKFEGKIRASDFEAKIKSLQLKLKKRKKATNKEFLFPSDNAKESLAKK